MIWFISTILFTLATPTLAFSAKTTPANPPAPLPSPFANMLPLMGYVFVGLIVVAVGLFLYGGILNLLKRADLYKDPLQDEIEKVGNNVITATDTTIKAQVAIVVEQFSSIGTSISSLNTTLSLAIEKLTSQTETINKEIQRLLGVTAVLDQHTQNMRAALDHDTHGMRQISQRQQDMKDLYLDKIKLVQDHILSIGQDVTSISNILRNEVFKERQARAFESIHELVKVVNDISKAVQAGRDLPIGTPVPLTYCQSTTTLITIENRIRGAVETIKNHREQVDKDIMTASKTTVVLLEQLVSRVDRLRDRVQELTVGE